MKIGLICPANLLYMPYVKNYAEILDGNKVDYEIINWDRLNIEPKGHSMTYRDSKVGHARNLFDYHKYKEFVTRIINKKTYDKIIVFGIQLAYLLRKYLYKKYKNKFILDIRDYNKVLNFFNLKKVIDSACFTVISSPGYQLWLPDSSKYVINHNTKIKSIDELNNLKIDLAKDIINISNIGAIRDFEINMKLVDSLKNIENIKLYFHGEGRFNTDINNYLHKHNIKNVFLTGRYVKEEEELFYRNSDLINILLPTTDINSKTLLPNRLYNAIVFGKPIIAFEGTYLANIVEEYNLGLILDSFDGVKDNIFSYLSKFDEKKYHTGRGNFINKVIEKNKEFTLKVKCFVKTSN